MSRETDVDTGISNEDSPDEQEADVSFTIRTLKIIRTKMIRKLKRYRKNFF